MSNALSVLQCQLMKQLKMLMMDMRTLRNTLLAGKLES